MTVIWWVRRDLRLADNPALQAALEAGGPSGGVLPVFVLDSALLRSAYAGEKRLAFLFAGLRALDADLRRRGSRLLLRGGGAPVVDELRRLVDESGAAQVFAEPDVSPYAAARDAAAGAALPMQWVGSPAVRPPGTVLKPDGTPYTVFTPFSKAWKALPGLPERLKAAAPAEIPTPAGFEGLSLPEHPALPPWVPFIAGEAEAQRRLYEFVRSERVYRYAEQRDRPDLDGTSQLSPYLRFGMLSPRQAAAVALQALAAAPGAEARRSAETWLNELIWREFYIHILYHHPRVRRENFRLPQVRWRGSRAWFEAWCAGQTGYPLVDAAMRQLVETGWMHNRLRMLTASFLTKDLLVDWRWGERFFMQHLVDGDPAANNGGWQWTAGTGTDAAPYFRIFSPVSQSRKHDPQAAFIRRWLPELAALPDAFIHEPWLAPPALRRQTSAYPAPLVDHALQRQAALEMYAAPAARK
ncbi:MAG: cryptochrome/photolyase family protein [Chloroflexota bacterium]